jgi:hypothetical protein
MRTAALSLALMISVLACSSVVAQDQRTGTAPLAINLSGVVDYSTEMPFVDLFRRARPWVSQADGKPWGQGPKLELTPDGWIARLAPGQYATTVISGGAHPAGLYTVLHDGKGKVEPWGDAKDINPGGPGLLTFTSTGKDSVFLHLRATDPADPVRNLRVLMPGVTDAQAKANPFYEPFLKRTAQFQAIRFMDWMDTNNSKVRTWDDRPKTTDWSWGVKGVPAEIMIDLANRTGCDPWFCMPHLADDSYVRSFASLVKSKLDAKRTAYVEHSNEVWNGQFEQARYAAEKGKEMKLSNNAYQAQLAYHSKRSVEIFAIWEKELGGTDRLVRVLATHSANPWTSEQVALFEDAYKQADVIAIAPYFGHALGSPKTVDEVKTMTVAQVLDRCREDMENNREATRKTATLAKKLGLGLIAYEAGQHLVGIHGAENDEGLTKLLHAANRAPGMGDLYRDYIRNWSADGGGLMAIFSSVARPSKWGSWGILEFEGQDAADAPKYRAVVESIKAPSQR